MKPLFLVALTLALVACGSTASSSSSSTETTSSTGSETTSSATAAPGPITRATLDEMQAAMFAAYPTPYETVFSDLSARYGSPMATDANGLSWWYAADGASCFGFYVNRANEGHAAGGIMESDAANCAAP